MVYFVDDILWDGTDKFKADVIDPLGQIFTIGSKFSQAFTCLGIEIHQNNDKSITIDQNNYAKAIQPTLWTTNQLIEKDVKNTTRGHFSNSRPDISFNTCNISTKVNNMKIGNVIELE